MNKIAGMRKCVRCGIEGEHGDGQTYCRSCHRKPVNRVSGFRLCSKCGVFSDHSSGQSKCKDCINAHRRALKAIKTLFLPT